MWIFPTFGRAYYSVGYSLHAMSCSQNPLFFDQCPPTQTILPPHKSHEKPVVILNLFATNNFDAPALKKTEDEYNMCCYCI